MFLIKYHLVGLILTTFLSKQLAKGVINNKSGSMYNQINGVNYKTLQTGTFYLNRNRPLWILQDHQRHDVPLERKQSFSKPLPQKGKYDHVKPIYFRNRQGPKLSGKRNYQNFKGKTQKRITFYNRPQLKLPRNYIPLSNNKRNSPFNPSPLITATQMPTFDSLPGEESFEKAPPVFLYTGHKGRMLFNTMLSSYKYPMQEPIPGQTLYPPPTLMFNAKQENTFTQRPLNVTMIPFYAYEAIDPRTINSRLYPTIASIPLTKPKRFKMAKQYSAYYAPQDILSHPFDSTTSVPLTLEKPYPNHKQLVEESTTSMPHKKLEVTYNDGEDKFRITYENENDVDEPEGNLERPTEVTTQEPQQEPWTYANYNTNYYTLPVYKLEEKEKGEGVNRNPKQQAEDVPETEEKGRESESVEETSKSPGNTWFILNSRYKGPLKSNNQNLHSSKYIQTTRSIQDNLDFLKTTTPTTPLLTKQQKLKPQMRALYGDNIEIVL